MKQKKRLSRRFMAFLLTAVLVLGSLSLSAFAETSGDTAEAASESADDGVSTADTESVSVTVGGTYSFTVSGSYSASDITGYNSDYISVSTSVTTTVTAGTKYESLSSNDSFYIYYTENGTTYYLVLSVSSGVGGNNSVSVTTTTDISEATLITYSSAGSGSGGSLSFTSGGTTYYLGVSSSNGGPSGSSVSLTASTSASTTWSYSSSTGFSTSVTSSSEGGPGSNGDGGGSTTTTYYLSAAGLSSSTSTYDYAISYTESSTTTITITGVAAGSTSFTLGEKEYSITVTASSTSSFELDISAYLKDGVVYWDMDDKDNDTYDTSETQTQSGASEYVTSVTLGSTTTTTVNTVPWADSTTLPTSSDNYNWSTTGLSLSSVYSAENEAEDEYAATLTITPAEGYYVTNVVITCAAYAPTSEGGGTGSGVTYARVSPYNCSTYASNHAFTNSFDMSSSTANGSGIAVSTSVKNLYFAHSGFVTDGFTSATDVQAVYFILVEVEEIPTPAYVEYDFGEIVDYISDYNKENDLSSDDSGYLTYSAFSSASGWTNASTLNVYKPSGSSSDGGVLTDDTQFKYTYDNSSSSSETSSDWEHYANSISNEAIKEAAAAGYVFAGWAVTWYREASTGSDSTEETADDSSTSTYNNYSITFSNYYSTGLAEEGDEIYIVGHVRLVAQWVAIEDITQVIDYGLPVSTDVEEEVTEDFEIKALVSGITSRTSYDQDLYENYASSDYKDFSDDVDFSVTGFVTETDSENTEPQTADADAEADSESTGDSETSTEYTYGTVEVSDNDDGKIVYTLTEQMTGVEQISYLAKLTYTTGNSTVTLASDIGGTVSIVPATSMYYEEDFGIETSTDENGNTTTTYNFITYTNGSKSTTDDEGNTTTSTTNWSSTGTALTSYQETGLVGDTTDSTYGTDAVYLDELGDSYGTSMYVNTTNASATFTYTFTGTGTTIYARTSTDSAYIGVFTYGEYDNEDETYNYYHGEYIDTRVIQDTESYSSGSSTTLYGIPVYDCTDLDYGTYTVYVVVYMADTYVDGWYTEDENGNETKVDGSDESGADFYLDGIRIYNPIDPDKENNTDVNDTYESVADVYEADGEDNMFLINVYEQLAMQEDDTSASSGFVTITDTDGKITKYNDYFDIGPNNEVYLWNSSTSTDSETEETSTTSYSVTFYVLYSSGDGDNDSTDFDIYIGMKSPLGGTTGASVTIGSDTTATTLNNSPDCYYKVTGTTSNLTVSESSVSAMKVTITGVSGLAALSYIKVVGSENVETAYDVDIDADNELTTELETDTVYLVSVASYEALLSIADTENEDEDDSDTDGEEDGDDQTDPENDDGDDEDTDPEDGNDTEEESVTVFTPEKFEASISYLKLLKYASITVKASSDVSYITVNEEKVTGRTIFGTTYYTYSASRVSSGTTYEIIAYDADGTASEAITLTAK